MDVEGEGEFCAPPGVKAVDLDIRDLCKYCFPLLDLAASSYRKFIRRIKMIYVGHGNSILVITDDNNVYGLGNNQNGYLGVGDEFAHISCITSPTRIVPLCQKSVISLCTSKAPHTLALTSSGHVYAWGNGTYGSLGIVGGGSEGSTQPVLVASNLGGNPVVEIACSSLTSMARTSIGEVYTWGYNGHGQIGNGSTNNQITPLRVSSTLENKKITSIAAGGHHSMVLTDEGEVYAWGKNGYGQIGNGNTNTCMVPVKIGSKLEGAVVIQIAAGDNHSMALTKGGNVFTWGQNNHGQLGSGTNRRDMGQITIVPFGEVPEESSPVGKEILKRRVVEIGTVSNTSCAVMENGDVYLWGQTGSLRLVTPTLTSYRSSDEALLCGMGNERRTWRPLIFDSNATKKRKTAEQFRNTFGEVFERIAADDESVTKECDLTFIVEGKRIKVHKAVISLRCEHFRNMFAHNWKESQGVGPNNEGLEIQGVTYAAFYAFLKYLYTNELDEELSPVVAIELKDLANSYCEKHLKGLCSDIIERGIKVENAAQLLGLSIRYRDEKAQKLSTMFILNFFSDVLVTPGFKELESDVCYSLLLLARDKKLFKT